MAASRSSYSACVFNNGSFSSDNNNKTKGAICRFNRRKGSSVIQEGSCCQIQTPRLELRPSGRRTPHVSGNYHGRGERSGIGGRKTRLHVQDGGGDKSLTAMRT